MKRIIFIVTCILVISPVLITAHLLAEDAKQGLIPQMTRNPFVNAPYSPARKDDGGAQKESAESTVRNMKVKGILIDRGHAVALIGRSVVKKGDVIGEFTVSGISRTTVTLLKGENVFNIFME